MILGPFDLTEAYHNLAKWKKDFKEVKLDFENQEDDTKVDQKPEFLKQLSVELDGLEKY